MCSKKFLCFVMLMSVLVIGSTNCAGAVAANWKMDDNAASTAVVDSGGSSLNGTFVDATGNPNTSAHHSVTCQEGTGSLNFDGVDDYVTMTRSSVLEVGNATTRQLSVSAWVKSDYASAPAGHTTTVGTGDGGWFIGSAPSTNGFMFACWLLNGSSGQTAVVSNPTAVFDGQWHHVIGVYDGGSIHIYVDGNHSGASTIGGTIRNMFDKSVLIGENAGATGRYWDGLVDDVKIYDEALSEQDVYHMYNPDHAWNPSPADGAASVDEISVTLNWSAGDSALTHDVYFGTSQSLVTSRDASVYEGNIGGTSHPVGTLLTNTEYFWAVDEVNGSNPESPWLGEVWSFTTSLGGGGSGLTVSSDGHWIEFRGEKSLLIGDSITQGWMELGANFPQETYIDALASRGINIAMIWSYMGIVDQVADDRIGYNAPEIWPWQSSSGIFDLNSFNTAYFTRLEDLVSYANDNDIVVLITIHDGWTKDRFSGHPFNTTKGGPLTSNSQYVELSNYSSEMGEIYNSGWTRQQKNQYFQERFVNRLIEAVGSYPNVIFEMFNEGEWYDQTNLRAHQVHFLNYIKARTNALTMVNDDHVGGTNFRGEGNCDTISYHKPNWSSSTSASTAFDYYDGEFTGTPAKPFYFSEPVPEYQGDSGMHDGLMRLMWGTVVAGAGFVVQNDTSWGFDTNTTIASQAADRDTVLNLEGYCCRFFNDSVTDLGLMTPNGSLASTGVCLANVGEEYVVYSQSGSTFTVNLSAASGKTLDCRFYNPRTGVFNTTFQRSGGSGAESFTKPGTSDWVLHIINPLPTLVTENLVAHITFDEGSGSTSSDLTGNGHTANLIGTSWGSGYVTIPPADDTARVAVTTSSLMRGQSFTWDLWFEADSSTSDRGRFCAQTSDLGGPGPELFERYERIAVRVNNLDCVFNVPTVGTRSNEGPPDHWGVSADTYHREAGPEHVILTHNGATKTVRVFLGLEGQPLKLTFEATYTGTYTVGSVALTLGNIPVATRPLNGEYYQFAYYNDVLTHQVDGSRNVTGGEVYQNHLAGSSGSSSGGQIPVITEVSPDPDTTPYAGVEYTKQLQLAQGTAPIIWSVVQGPAGIAVSSSGYVDNWIPGGCDVGESVAIEIRAQNGEGSDTETWHVEPKLYYMPDNIANLSDLMMMAEEWLATSGPMATDLDCSGSIDLVDFATLGQVWLEEQAEPELAITSLLPTSYAVSYNNLNVGGLIYVDRTYTYTTVPAAYQNKTYIKTSNEDKDGSPNNSISFTVNRAVTVYVAHDDRIVTKPGWMSTFTNTGDDLVSSSESAHLSLYSKSFPAGAVNLGANEGSQPNCSMYTVVVIEQ